MKIGLIISCASALVVGVGFAAAHDGRAAGLAAQAAAQKPAHGVRQQHGANANAANATLRTQVWNILAAQTGNGTQMDPDWEGQDWNGKCTLGLGNDLCNQPSSKLMLLESPPQDRAVVPSAAKAMESPFRVSEVLYNTQATARISSGHLADLKTWQCLSGQPGSGTCVDALKFDKQAMIVKEIWENVPATCVESPSPTQTTEACPQKIPVWDPTKVEETASGPDVQLPAVNSWTSSMLPIDTDVNRLCDTTKAYPYIDPNQRKPPKSEWTPIRCFHYRWIQPGINATLPAGAGQVVGNSEISGNGHYIVLVGFHLILADQPDWTWATFWWTKPGVDTGMRNDHPAGTLGKSVPWGLYSMDAVNAATPLAQDGGPKEIFNPYLEGPQTNGPVSNCMSCHSHAVYRNRTTAYVENDVRENSKPRCLLINPFNTGCTPTHYRTEDQYISGATRTHFLWSLAFKQDKTASRNSQNFTFGDLQRGSVSHETSRHNAQGGPPK